MSLVITNVSNLGIAMVADSSISMMLNNGQSIEKHAKDWRKLLKVPRIVAGISYWGYIGLVTGKQFDHWLGEKIHQQTYGDLITFAEFIASEMNRACGRRIFSDPVGVHVAGYAKWEDGVVRPYFFHIHNGGGHNDIRFIEDPNTHQLKEIKVSWVARPPKPFEVHQDFPFTDKNLDENLAALEAGYETRNGDFFLYSVLGPNIDHLFNLVNHIEGFQIPRDTTLAGRAAILKLKIDFMIDVYKHSTYGQIVGGESTLLGIRPDMRYI